MHDWSHLRETCRGRFLVIGLGASRRLASTITKNPSFAGWTIGVNEAQHAVGFPLDFGLSYDVFEGEGSPFGPERRRALRASLPRTAYFHARHDDRAVA